MSRYIATLLAAAIAVPVLASGEEPAPVWSVEGADCQYRVDSHQVETRPGLGGEVTEQFEIRAGAGTYVYASRPIPQALVIEDLELAVWIQSDRRGIQVLGRVVFPETIDPVTGKPAEVLVPGQLYHRVGFWQKLELDDLTHKTQRQLRVLRARLDRPVDARGAYVASLIVNLFGGPGGTRVSIGAIETVGRVEPQQVHGGASTTHAASSASRVDRSFARSVPKVQLDSLVVDGRPFFPRIVDHHGEPFAILAGLGFNAVSLSSPPNERQIEEALAQRLWLVCPPPGEGEMALTDSRPVLAWYFGPKLSVEDSPRRRYERLRRLDPSHRPVVAGVEDKQWLASRQVDLLLRERQPLGTSFELARFGPWLQESTRLVRPGTPYWSVIQTELAPSIVGQLEAASSATEEPIPRRVQAQQIRQLALASVSSGARGLWFRSDRRLDRDDDDTRFRRVVLQSVNLELSLVAPWIMGGQQLGEVESDNPELRVVALSTDRSRLLIPTRRQMAGQYVSSYPADGNTLVVAGVPDSTDVFLLSPTGLHAASHRRISGGLQVNLEPGQADAIVLMTQDPLIVSYVNQVAAAQRQRAAELQLQLAEAELLDIRRQAEPDESEDGLSHGRLRQSRAILQAAHRLLESGSATEAFEYARHADAILSQIKRDMWQNRVARLPAGTIHPAVASFALLPWLEADLAANATPLAASDRGERNLLKTGECENLSQMVRAGWRQHQASPDDVNTYLALSSEHAHSGQRSLRLRVDPQSDGAKMSVMETPPLWVNSAPVTVRSGERVRVQGWIRIDSPIAGGADGCLITDSIGGTSLGMRFYRTEGWMPFELIRRVDRDDHLTVTVALTGSGEVFLDDLSVTRLPPETVTTAGRLLP